MFLQFHLVFRVEVIQLFQCIICGVAYSNRQSLRARMKVHKGEYMRTSIQVKKDSWEKFEDLCKRHKTTTCHVVNTLAEGIVDGEKSGNVSLPKILSPNPIVINLTHNFIGQPRSSWKVDVTESFPLTSPHCLVCGSKKVYQHTPVTDLGGKPILLYS